MDGIREIIRKSSDFDVYINAARELYSGGNPWGEHSHVPYLYPPGLALILGVVAFLPLIAAKLTWLVVQLLSLKTIVQTYGSSKTSPSPLRSIRLSTSTSMALVLTYPVLQNEIRNGQANLAITWLCVLALTWSAGRRTMLGPALIGLAASIKLTPIYMVLGDLFRLRLDRIAIAVGVTVGICGLPYSSAEKTPSPDFSIGWRRKLGPPA